MGEVIRVAAAATARRWLCEEGGQVPAAAPRRRLRGDSWRQSPRRYRRGRRGSAVRRRMRRRPGGTGGASLCCPSPGVATSEVACTSVLSVSKQERAEAASAAPASEGQRTVAFVKTSSARPSAKTRSVPPSSSSSTTSTGSDARAPERVLIRPHRLVASPLIHVLPVSRGRRVRSEGRLLCFSLYKSKGATQHRRPRRTRPPMHGRLCHTP